MSIYQATVGHSYKMTTDTAYGIREDKVSSLPLSVKRIEELLVPFNPINYS